MNALLLPGNSPRHAEWVEDLRSALLPGLAVVKTQQYRHWRTGEERADVAYETAEAKDNASGLDPYVIVAKSIGTVIAVKGVADGVLAPTKLILLGVPIRGGTTVDEFLGWLSSITTTVVIVQNTADPLGSFADVRTAFEKAGPHVSFVELTGTTHDYLNFAAIKSLT